MSSRKEKKSSYGSPPDNPPREEAAMPYNPGVEHIPITDAAGQAKTRHQQALLGIDGVNGVGIGRTEIGDPAIVVYVRDKSVAKRIPSALDGVPVRIEVSGEFDAL